MGGMRHQWPVSHKLIPGRLVSLVSPEEAGFGRQQPSSLPGALASASRIPGSRLRLRPSSCGLAEAPRSRTEQRSRPALILSLCVPGACACWEHTRAGRSGGARVSDSGRELRVLLVFLSPPPAVMSRPGANCLRSVALGTPRLLPQGGERDSSLLFLPHPSAATAAPSTHSPSHFRPDLYPILVPSLHAHGHSCSPGMWQAQLVLSDTPTSSCPHQTPHGSFVF